MVWFLLRQAATFLRSILARFLIHLALTYIAPSHPIGPKGPKTSPRRLPKPAWTKLTIDRPLPLIEPAPKVPHYTKLLQEYLNQNGKPLKPIARRPNSLPVPNNIKCPFCKAPAPYIYHNNGGRGQFLCKVCRHTFHRNTKPQRIRYRCPYCFRTLQRVKQRKAFDVYKCTHKDCPFRRRQLRRLSRLQRKQRTLHPYEVKLSYIFRKPNIDWTPGKITTPKPPTVDLARIHNPLEVVALCLYFFTNHALSLRQIQQTLFDLYGIRISHQTVLNYVEAAALRLLPLAFQAGLDIGHDWAIDETYVRIRATWGYLFFAYNPTHRRIAAFILSKRRDTHAASRLLAQLTQKTNPTPSTPPHIVTDANPIYKLATAFLANYIGIPFHHSIVLGITPTENESPEARLLKQLVERLHRSFKDKYRHTTGFKSLNGAFVFAALFVLWFNYLHTQSPPLPELLNCPFAPAKWLLLLQKAETVKEQPNTPS